MPGRPRALPSNCLSPRVLQRRWLDPLEVAESGRVEFRPRAIEGPTGRAPGRRVQPVSEPEHRWSPDAALVTSDSGHQTASRVEAPLSQILFGSQAPMPLVPMGPQAPMGLGQVQSGQVQSGLVPPVGLGPVQSGQVQSTSSSRTELRESADLSGPSAGAQPFHQRSPGPRRPGERAVWGDEEQIRSS